jgi:hypothetical protein
MAVDRTILESLAANRRERKLPDGRFRIDLSPELIEGSTHGAMRLAAASRPQVEARLRAEENSSSQ